MPGDCVAVNRQGRRPNGRFRTAHQIWGGQKKRAELGSPAQSNREVNAGCESCLIAGVVIQLGAVVDSDKTNRRKAAMRWMHI